ncbi:3D domain-containing protein [Paraliobacillus sediminis]|uniref:3D domain-containing protein n=1 Tax=Paraliobacillus sediminis TaxID=1885916 RepID=UPI000E3BA4EF|nr:3D domain-containing protein [Paraliobacillus sediminis]
MNKKVVAFAIGLSIVGTATTTASAEEYQVVKGDNLWEIAQENESSVDELMEINELDKEMIFPGQTLQIDKEIVYIVKKGDSLSEIADEYDVVVEELIKWNDLSSDLILIDQELRIQSVKHVGNETQAASTETTEPVAAEPAEVDETPVAEEVEEVSTTNEEQAGETITVTATAYTAECEGCSGITATGINLNEDRNKKVIAVDPSVIPLGTKVYVEGYGEAIAGDTGGAIKGSKIDIHVPTKDEAYQWGVRTVDVTILN